MVVKTYGKLRFDPEYVYKREYQDAFKVVDLKGPRWVMEDCEPHVAMRLKQLFQRLLKGQSKNFVFEDNEMNAADLHWFITRYPVQMSIDDRNYLNQKQKDFVEHVNQMEAILNPNYIARELTFDGVITLRNYQLQFMDVFAIKKRTLLGDGIGLGKTFSCVGAARLPDALPCAVVVQTHLPKQYIDMIKELFGENARIHQVSKTTPYNLPVADFYVFKYTQLAKWSPFFEKKFFKHVIFDEVQELRRKESAKYLGAKSLSSNANYCVGASGSPMVNYADEIWNILDVIDEGCLGSYADFSREWLGYDGRSVKNPAALNSYLKEQYLLIRRTRSDVGRELPPINRVVQYVETDEKALKAVEDLAQALAVKALHGSFTERGQARRDLDIMVRQATGISKAKSVAQYAKLFLENGEKIVLVGWHRAVYDIWLEELKQYNPVMYTGSESPKQKDDSLQKFLHGDAGVFILSSRSGAGLNDLQKVCSTILFGELDWSNKIHDQAIGRLHRDGLLGGVMAVFLVCDEGSDPPIIDLLALKDSQSTQIMDGEIGAEEIHSDDSRLKVLAEHILKRRKVTDMDCGGNDEII